MSDFGLNNEWVGTCHLVMRRIAPESPVIDLSHLIPALNILAGALLLTDSVRFLPDDAVVLAVVDPKVGKEREIAVQAPDGRLFVAPDNGILWPTLTETGIDKVVEINSPEIVIEPVSPSFRTRDVLSPATAQLARGMEIESLGPTIDPETLVTLAAPEPEVDRGKISCEVIDFNRFGNLTLNVREQHLAAAGLSDGAHIAVETTSASAHARRAHTYSDFEQGEYGVIIDPRGWLMVVRGNPASAIQGLGVDVGDPVWLSGEDL
jgi:S-adenosylmethionine hydrolase